MIVAGILGLSVMPASAESYRWTDKDGEVHYGAAVPAEYADQPYDVLNKAGLVIKHVEATREPIKVVVEEKAKEKKPLISEDERRIQSDRLLVIQYRSEEDIEKAMELELAQLGYDSQLIRQSVRSTRAAIRDQIKLAADRQRANMDITPDQKEALRHLYARQEKDREKQLAVTKREERIRARFQTSLERYRFLTSGNNDNDDNEVQVDKG